ncbi:MAG TPA: nuclear transport factor 2 family protein [Rubrivivax sp.]|nr:nuclear transport factor 2 family protein [Rubrivivax sp.]
MDDQAAILDADARRYRAMRDGDLDRLAALLAEDLAYTHSSGVCDDKGQYLASMASGRFRYLQTATEEVEVRIYGAAAVMLGRARFHAIVDGAERRLDNRFLSVWTRAAEGWQMAAWSSSPIPAGH